MGAMKVPKTATERLLLWTEGKAPWNGALHGAEPGSAAVSGVGWGEARVAQQALARRRDKRLGNSRTGGRSEEPVSPTSFTTGLLAWKASFFGTLDLSLE